MCPAGQGHRVALGDGPHRPSLHLPVGLLVEDGDLPGRGDQGEGGQGVAGLGRLEVHPAPVLALVTRVHPGGILGVLTITQLLLTTSKTIKSDKI